MLCIKEEFMMFYIQTPSPTPRSSFDPDIIWRVFRQLGSSLHDVLRKTKGVLSNPEPWVYVSELAPSSVNFSIYFWTGSRQANVLALINEVTTGIKNALDQAHIDIPYPQIVVHPDEAVVANENNRE